MKKIYLLIVVLFLLIPGLQTSAFDMKAGDEFEIVEEVNGDLYVAGGRVDVDAPINGDLVITGGDLNINSDIAEDLIIAGGDIIISGNIGDDVRVAGGNIEIKGNINGDLIVGGGDLRIGKDTIIKGDLVVGAGRIILNGEVLGNAKIGAGELVLNGIINGDSEITIDSFDNPLKSGIIRGNINYKSDKKIQALEDSTNALVTFEKTFFEENMKKRFFGFITSYLLVKILGIFLFSTLIFLYFEKLFTKVSKILVKETGKSFLYGFVTIIGLPIIIVLLFISVIGIPFGLFLLFAYIFLFVFLGLINVIIFSSLLIKKYSIKILYQKLLIIFGLSIIFATINGISFIAGLFTIGAIAIVKIDIFKNLRK